MNTVKNVEKAGRQVWLAGLGACLVGKEYAVKKLDELFEGTNALVNEVISKGHALEGELKGKLPKGFPQDEKIAELREKLGLNKESKHDKIARLAAKIDALTDIVATISVKAEQAKTQVAKPAKVKDADPASKPAAKSTSTRKPRATASKSASTTATKKPASRRTTTRKTTGTASKTDKE